MTWPPSFCWFWFRSVTGAEDCKNNWTPGEPPTSETVETKPRYISSGSRYGLSCKHYFLGRDTSPREVSFVVVEETISGLGSNTSGFSRFSYHHNKAQRYATGPKGQRPVLQSPESTCQRPWVIVHPWQQSFQRQRVSVPTPERGSMLQVQWSNVFINERPE